MLLADVGIEGGAAAPIYIQQALLEQPTKLRNWLINHWVI